MTTRATRRHDSEAQDQDAQHTFNIMLEPVQAHARRLPANEESPSVNERVAISGSRERTDRETIEAVIDALPAGTVVLTGGCAGPDLWAEEAARRRGLAVETYAPSLPEQGPRYVFTRAFYQRNRALVDACDRLIAFPIGPRGGTWHTVGQAVELGKPVTIVPCRPARYTPAPDSPGSGA